MRKFEKLANEIGNSFSVAVNKLFAPRELKVYRLGFYRLPSTGIMSDLSEYFIDEEGDVFSLNDDTYFTKYGIRLKQLSNGAYTNGLLVNSFRDRQGKKVTISRNKLKSMRDSGMFELVSFDNLPVVQGKIDTKNFSAGV